MGTTIFLALLVTVAEPPHGRPTPKASEPPSSHPLKWAAPRGDHGFTPRDGQWPIFLGHMSPALQLAYQNPAHRVIVPTSGVRPAPDHPAVALSPQQIVHLLTSRGAPAAVAAQAADHVLLGLPTDAVRQSREDYLVVRKDVVFSYSDSRRGPNWVSWRTNASNLGPRLRSDDHWRADPTLPDNFTPATFGDYRQSGHDPGHMLRSGERESSPRANARTYVTSNTVPQSFNNNRGPWLHFENFTRDFVINDPGAEIHVIAGGAWGREPLTIGAGVPVPAATWKVAVVLRRGQTAADIDEHTRVMAVLIPNNDVETLMTDSFSKFVTTPAAIEQATGLRFFTSLPALLAEKLRQKIDPATLNVPAPPPPTN
jgi:endonuclease G